MLSQPQDLVMLQDHTRSAAPGISPSLIAEGAKFASTASTRQWSDMDHGKLLGTVAFTNATCSVLSNPLYMVLARQQCRRDHVSTMHAARDIYQSHGIRGFFRGCVIGAAGMVAFQASYYVIVDLWKEHGPSESKMSRDFGSGVVAEGLTAPIYMPFAVISQRQMVAGCGLAAEDAHASVFQTTRELVRESGHRALFRGLGLTVMMLPLAGCWWALYEFLKCTTYDRIAKWKANAATFYPSHATSLPSWINSTTDNALVNLAVGGVASGAVAVLANPFYVVRSRVQVMRVPTGTRCSTCWVARDLYRQEGFRACFRGLRTNVIACVLEGSAFAALYEGSRLFADTSSA